MAGIATGIATSRLVRKLLADLLGKKTLIPAAVPEGPEKGTYAFALDDIGDMSRELVEAETRRATGREDEIEANARRINAEGNGNGTLTFTNYSGYSKTIQTGKPVQSSDGTVAVTENAADFDLSVQPKLDEIHAELDSESERAKGAETELRASVLAEAIARQDQITQEATRAAAAEASLQGQITQEATRAAAAEASLQGQINTANTRITAVENLGHYAGSFQTRASLPSSASAFPQGITPNDFATVQADETRGGATTRYIAAGISNGNISWAYDVTYSTDISGKQDKLAAGANVQISSGNVISATDTIPNNPTVTLQKNGAGVDSFTLNQAAAKTINIALSKGDVGLGNVPNTDATNPANIAWSASYRASTDAEKAAWNAKQNALNRAVGGNADATGTVTDTGGSLSIPIPVTVDSISGSSAQLAASPSPYSLKTVLQRILDNIMNLFGRLAAAETGISGKVSKTGDAMTGALTVPKIASNSNKLEVGDNNNNGNLWIKGSLSVTDSNGTERLVIENDDASWRGRIGSTFGTPSDGILRTDADGFVSRITGDSSQLIQANGNLTVNFSNGTIVAYDNNSFIPLYFHT